MADFKSILTAIEKHITLDDVERSILHSLLESRLLKAGDFIQTAGEPSPYFIFVSMGCLMSYHLDDGGVERVMQFATAAWWTGDLHSFQNHKPSNYTTRALVDSEVLLWPERVTRARSEIRKVLQDTFPELTDRAWVTDHGDDLFYGRTTIRGLPATVSDAGAIRSTEIHRKLSWGNARILKQDQAPPDVEVIDLNLG